jgi:hypothetical protein
MSSILRNIDAIFEDNTSLGANPMERASSISQELAATQKKLADLQNQLESIQQELHGSLALAVRRLKPGLNVGVNQDGCKIGFKTKFLLLSPDVENGIWKVNSKDKRFANVFARKAGRALALGDDLSLLTRALVGYFTQHYKSLGEDISGTGLVVVENKMSTLIKLAEWHKQHKPQRRLNSRRIKALV